MISTPKSLLLSAVVLAIGFGCGRADEPEPEKKELDPVTVKKNASYGFGRQFGENFEQEGIELDIDQFIAGLKDGFEGKESKISEDDLQAAMQAFQEQIAKKQRELAAKRREEAMAAAKELGEKNKAEGEAFLKANAEKEGVKSTESGLQYKVVKEGTGKSPKATDVVKVHYHGTLISGDVFDSSVQRGEPIEFPLDGVIKGWTEGVQLMKVGGKTTFYIPSDLAYGENPRPGGPIGPNAVLVFDVELLDIVEEE